MARVGAADKGHLEAYFKGFHVDPILTALAASGHKAAEIGEVVAGEPELRIL